MEDAEERRAASASGESIPVAFLQAGGAGCQGLKGKGIHTDSAEHAAACGRRILARRAQEAVAALAQGAGVEDSGRNFGGPVVVLVKYGRGFIEAVPFRRAVAASTVDVHVSECRERGVRDEFELDRHFWMLGEMRCAGWAAV